MWHTLPFLLHTVTRADMRARTHTNHMHMHMHMHTRRAHMVMEECRNFMQLIYEQSPDYFSRAHSSFIYTHDERSFIKKVICLTMRPAALSTALSHTCT